MYRVRKLSRKNPVASAQGEQARPRVADFQLAGRRIARREPSGISERLDGLRELNRIAGAPRGSLKAVEQLARFEALAVVVPLAVRHWSPSLHEVLRLVTAFRLSSILRQRINRRLFTVLWPGVPAAMDTCDHFVASRDGTVASLPYATGDAATSVARVEEVLPKTGFTPWLLELLSRTWNDNPILWKLRLLFAATAQRDTVALVTGDIFIKESQARAAMPRTVYRAQLSRLLEAFGVLSVVYTPEMDSKAGDASVGPLAASDTVPFPSVSATFVESKVERWLEKFQIEPELLLAQDAQVSRLAAEAVPSNPQGTIRTAREAVLQRIFRLEHIYEEIGFEGGVALDRLANLVDQNFDHLRKLAGEAEQRERETALNQLTKARSFLRPAGKPQVGAMSLVHYLNFYGPTFFEELLESIEPGDSRHHMVYVGA